MPTRTEVDNLIATNLADLSRIEPSEHRAVEKEILDYVDQEITSIQSSLGIYLKDNDLIIPNSGSFINGLDFAGASTSYLEVIKQYNKLEINGGVSNAIDIASTNSLTVTGDFLTGATTSSNPFSNFTFTFNPLPDNDYDVYVNIVDGVISGNNASILMPHVYSKAPNELSFRLREFAPVGQDFRMRVKLVHKLSLSEKVSQEQSNVDLSVGGVFAISSLNAQEFLRGINLVITGGTTPGTYRFF